jgi:hypothetical protein
MFFFFHYFLIKIIYIIVKISLKKMIYTFIQIYDRLWNITKFKIYDFFCFWEERKRERERVENKINLFST